LKISFVVPAHNSAAWLSQAVQSVLEQTHKDVECVVVDDASTDSTKDYLDWQVRQDTRVKAVRNEVNKGRSASRNIGNAIATGDVLCVLDADDLAIPSRAKTMVEKFSKGAEFVYGSAVQMDACGRSLGEIRADVFDKKKALESMVNRIVHSSVAYTPDFAKRFPYQEGEASRLGCDDWQQQITAAVSGVRLDFVPNVLCAYRVLESGVSRTRNESEVRIFKAKYLDSLKVNA
jgi:glycosyltransferase involved in cell wall biosynthesis